MFLTLKSHADLLSPSCEALGCFEVSLIAALCNQHQCIVHLSLWSYWKIFTFRPRTAALLPLSAFSRESSALHKRAFSIYLLELLLVMAAVLGGNPKRKHASLNFLILLLDCKLHLNELQLPTIFESLKCCLLSHFQLIVAGRREFKLKATTSTTPQGLIYSQAWKIYGQLIV